MREQAAMKTAHQLAELRVAVALLDQAPARKQEAAAAGAEPCKLCRYGASGGCAFHGWLGCLTHSTSFRPAAPCKPVQV